MRPNPLEEAELIEYFQGLNSRVETVYEPMELFLGLHEHLIDIVFFNVRDLDDFALIRYINDNYQDTSVIASLDSGLSSRIENVRQVSFSPIRHPFHLEDLGQCVQDCRREKETS